MAFANYTDLQASIASWMNRGDLASKIPDFIQLAEARIARDLRVRKMLATVTLATTAGGSVALPDGFLDFKSMTLNGSPLEYMTPEQMAYQYGTLSMLPSNYTIDGANVVFGPAPDGAYSVPARYYKRIAPLSVEPTNWLLTEAPNLYLHGALIEGYIFIKNTKEVGEQGALFQATVDALHLADARSMHNGSTLRVRAR